MGVGGRGDGRVAAAAANGVGGAALGACHARTLGECLAAGGHAPAAGCVLLLGATGQDLEVERLARCALQLLARVLQCRMKLLLFLVIPYGLLCVRPGSWVRVHSTAACIVTYICTPMPFASAVRMGTPGTPL